jgi:hypothetical protein
MSTFIVPAFSALLTYGVFLICFLRLRGLSGHLAILNFYHFLFAALFFQITHGLETDSSNYFQWAHDATIDLGVVGSGAIVRFVRLLGMVGLDTYILAYYFFAALSAFGVMFAYLGIVGYVRQKGLTVSRQAVLLCFMLPGLHFWTSAIGKDAVIIFVTGLGIYNFGHKRSWLLFAGLVIAAAMVRPHVGLLMGMVMCHFSYATVSKRMVTRSKPLFNTFGNLLIVVAMVGSYYVALSYIQKYSPTGFQGVGEFIGARADIYAGQGSGFDASTYPFMFRFFLVFLGGVPWAISGGAQLASIVEGTIVLSLAVWAMWRGYKLRLRSFLVNQKEIYADIKYMAAYGAMLCGLIALLASNFGLISRQRVMFYLPVIFVFVVIRRMKVLASQDLETHYMEIEK